MTNHSIIAYAVMRELAMKAATHWKRYVYPLPFDHVFPLEGLRVHIVIERRVEPEDTQPVRRVERDEDDRIEDG